ncbi:MAG: sodium-translocating pyrophosphatase [Puniceicoccales bacterium]|jgi:K(+)-stimulated pyrophosphate-energized sodium pump|nr:sodium-translocating pyrophosphatase [Puniceicoccales bacterium]
MFAHLQTGLATVLAGVGDAVSNAAAATATVVNAAGAGASATLAAVAPVAVAAAGDAASATAVAAPAAAAAAGGGGIAQSLFWLTPAASVLALAFAAFFYKRMKAADEGTERMQEIAQYVREGAMAYLKQQYKVVGIFFVLLTVVFAYLAYGLGIQNGWVPFAFLTGGFFSGLAGFFGMKTATYASNRVAAAARKSLNAGLQLAFRSGAVMGLVVVGLALVDISVWFLVLREFIPETPNQLAIITTTMLTFGMGASLQALFARVGGGIYTKAADVGADIAGKVVAGLNEDDPHNPATIADNVGDNVGDVAGMGADLYESYAGSILATAALGAAAALTPALKSVAEQDANLGYKLVVAPMVIAAVGTVLSILGIFAVRTKEGATQKNLLSALGRGVNLSSLLIVLASAGILHVLGVPNNWGIWGAIVTGLVAGLIIGQSTEYYTSQEYKPTKRIAESATKGGAATVIISGIGVGMLSTAIPVVVIAIGTTLAYCLAAGDWTFSADKMALGLYGIGIAAVGMLSTLGITLATDAYGPIADNAGGNAEMSGLEPEVRKRTDALDALGNTTAATGKGFAIGSAALTALALLASYVEELKIAMEHAGQKAIEVAGKSIPLASATLTDFMNYFEVNLMNPKVIVGLFLGSMMAFLFCGLTINAVGRAAQSMVEEIVRQFKGFGILGGDGKLVDKFVDKQSGKVSFPEGLKPDYATCVAISTRGAQREMIVPSLIAVVVPILTGLVLGVSGVFGLLGGGLAGGFVLAVFMANSGGAWDNAKKYVEEGNFGGKRSEAHKATVVGDTVGDPFKDTAGPSLNILIKLMSMVSIVTAGVNVAVTLLGK